MQEQLGMLKPTVVEEPIMSESVTPPALLPGRTISLAENIGGSGGQTREEKKGNYNNKATKSADTQMQGSSTAEDKAAKIERLKSGFQICKPQGTFMWPNMGLSPQAVANLDEHTVVPTPSSASSSTSKSQTQHLPLPSSPVKPLAERRPVSTATLTHVTAGPFSPHLSPPLGTPRSTITITNTKNNSSINLNEAPLTLE